MRTINWIFTIFHGKDDKHYLNIVNVFTVCLFNALNIYVCSGPYIRRRFCQYHKAKCYSIVNACHVYSSLLIQPLWTCSLQVISGCCRAAVPQPAILAVDIARQVHGPSIYRPLRASPRVCHILLGISCVLPTSKKICQVKKTLPPTVWYNSLAKLRSNLHQES